MGSHSSTKSTARPSSLRFDQKRRRIERRRRRGFGGGPSAAGQRQRLGGSLRNPANFDNIVALRPSVGLGAIVPVALPFFGFTVKGPVARSVADAAFLLSVMAGVDARDPACSPSDPRVCPTVGARLQRRSAGLVSGSRRLAPRPAGARGGWLLSVETFVDLGCAVEDALPDLTGADEVFFDSTRVALLAHPRIAA